jgi:PAS domain S-box-containing protein
VGNVRSCDLRPILALLIRLPLASVLADKVPFITFFLATASFGGFGPGLVATTIGAFLAANYIILPVGSVVFNDPDDYFGLGIFLVISSFISYICGRLLDARRYEHAVRQLFQQTLISIGDGVISTDSEHRIRFMNRVAEELTGWREHEAKDKRVEEVFRIVREDSDTPAAAPLAEAFKTEQTVGLASRAELITKDGRRIAIDVSASPIKDDQGDLVGAVLVFRDITERRRTELALEAAEKRSRTVLESITEGIVKLREIRPTAPLAVVVDSACGYRM